MAGFAVYRMDPGQMQYCLDNSQQCCRQLCICRESHTDTNTKQTHAVMDTAPWLPSEADVQSWCMPHHLCCTRHCQQQYKVLLEFHAGQVMWNRTSFAWPSQRQPSVAACTCCYCLRGQVHDRCSAALAPANGVISMQLVLS